MKQHKAMKRFLIFTLGSVLCCGAMTGAVKNSGGISSEMLQRLEKNYNGAGANKALRNALAGNDIDKLAYNSDNANGFDTHFSDRVESKGITNQKSSGRCWLFTGLNVLRSQMMRQHDLPELYLSQNYNFFFDQLEKSNLFLQGMIDYASRPDDDEMVDWLFKNPLSDGGQYTGLSDNLLKYGVVPAGVMRESYSAENTSKVSRLIGLKLREYGLELRKMHKQKAGAKKMQARKEEMLGDIYRMLAITMGQPPKEFTWTRRDGKGNVVSTKTYTPQSFYAEYAGNDLKNDYIMFMNDPTREYYKVYEIDYDRHVYDGDNWRYVNLPMDEIKKMAIESIKDSTMMYFSCDVGKFLDRERGVLDVDNYDYESLFGVKFGMDKTERIRTHASASSHAMTLMAVDLDQNGKPLKWMVENSWGDGANNGHLIITDKWMDEYMFRLVVNKKYIPQATQELLKQKSVILPAWDPLFKEDE